MPPSFSAARIRRPLSGPDMNAPRAVTQRERATRPADPRVDNRKMHALGHERKRVRVRQRTLQDGLRCDAVCDVDDLDVWRDPFDHAVTGADEIVLQSEVRQERDEARHAAAESTRAATSCVLASATTSSPTRRAASVVWGPIVIAGRRGPTFPHARAADGDASRTRSPAGHLRRELDSPVDGPEVCGQLVGDQPAGACGARRTEPAPPAVAAPRGGRPGRKRMERRRPRAPARREPLRWLRRPLRFGAMRLRDAGPAPRLRSRS